MLEFTVTEQADGRKISSFLRAQGVSASLIRSVKYMPQGILCNGESVHTNALVHTGDVVQFADAMHTDTEVLAQDLPLSIVYEDAQMMVLNKPAYMAVHPTRNYPDGTLANAFCGEMQRRGTPMPFRLVNRLDRNTSGLVLCAMSAFGALPLSKSVKKTYIAIAEGTVHGSGTVSAKLGFAPGSVIKRAVVPDGKPAVTHYEVLAYGGGHTLLRLTLETGRTHQIRVHMAHLGHPLAGDEFYGGHTTCIARHALHCAEMTCLQPYTGEEMHFTAALPQDMRLLAKECGFVV